MNTFPRWKYILVLVVIVLGLVYAAPNVYTPDPALQITSSGVAEMDADTANRIEAALRGSGIPAKSIETTDTGLLVRLVAHDDQLRAREVVASALGSGYVTALNLAPATPGWLRMLGASPMYLGLDLRGGVHFLMEVDMDAAVDNAEERYVSDLRGLLRKNKIRYKAIGRSKTSGVQVTFRDAEELAKADSLISSSFSDLRVKTEEKPDSFKLVARLTEQAARATRKFALEQNITTLRNRVNELGVSEPLIQQQGDNRIVIQLPGVQDTARAKEILGATATLEFRLVDSTHDVQDALDGHVPVGTRLYRERNGAPVLLKKRVMLTGEYIIDASSSIDSESGSPSVLITLDGKGGRLFQRATANQVGKRMAVVFLETKTETRKINGKSVKFRTSREEVINIAVIREQLSKRFQITGIGNTSEARDLALLLRAGSLAAPTEIIEERTVGPSLGQENIDQGVRSVMIGFVLVLIFMGIYYRVFGLVANLALAFNLVSIIALLSLLQATLTLPGIAGIVLTVGMAVDANVLIFERIREEIANGNSPHASIQAGYEKAFSTIADANITTLIAALVLYGFGTGPIKGFAITLSLGIMTSMFTSIVGTRAAINVIYGRRRVSSLSI